MSPIVVKVGGNEIDDPFFLESLAAVIVGLSEQVVIVHGGGKEISTLQKVMGIEPTYVDGVRVTDASSLAIVEMVLCGTVNTRLVRYLLAAGVDALGMSGVDRGLIRAEKMPHVNRDMEFTGQVKAVQGEILLELLANGITPVIAPISLGADNAYNVNADHVAGAVAAGIQAVRMVFLTNVEGVLVDGQLQKRLTPAETRALIDDGTIFGGMIPKVQTALHALESGVSQVVITNLQGLKLRGGTVFMREVSPA